MAKGYTVLCVGVGHYTLSVPGSSCVAVQGGMREGRRGQGGREVGEKEKEEEERGRDGGTDRVNKGGGWEGGREGGTECQEFLAVIMRTVAVSHTFVCIQGM